MMAMTTPTMRPVETLDFEGVEVAAGDEDGAADLVVAINELEDVGVEETEDVGVEEAEDVGVEEAEDDGVGEMMIVEVADAAADCEVLNVGCDAFSDVVVSTEFVFEFLAGPGESLLDAGVGGGGGVGLSRCKIRGVRIEEGVSARYTRWAWPMLSECAW
jgi:hypothetical protein